MKNVYSQRLGKLNDLKVQRIKAYRVSSCDQREHELELVFSCTKTE